MQLFQSHLLNWQESHELTVPAALGTNNLRSKTGIYSLCMRVCWRTCVVWTHLCVTTFYPLVCKSNGAIFGEKHYLRLAFAEIRQLFQSGKCLGFTFWGKLSYTPLFLFRSGPSVRQSWFLAALAGVFRAAVWDQVSQGWVLLNAGRENVSVFSPSSWEPQVFLGLCLMLSLCLCLFLYVFYVQISSFSKEISHIVLQHILMTTF